MYPQAELQWLSESSHDGSDAPTPFSSTRATRAGALRAHGLGVIFLRAGRYAASFQGRDAAHELTWDLCGKSHLFQPGISVPLFGQGYG